jgi:hypothetical protein
MEKGLVQGERSRMKMATWGISVYLGTPETAARLPGYLERVGRLGGTEVFTSLHIPEVPFEQALAQLTDLTGTARVHGLQVVADVAPGTLQKLGVTPEQMEPLERLGLAGVRLDYGFGPEQIARFAQNRLGLRIQLNASTMDPAFLRATMAAGADPALLEVCHNFYPRPETGISLAHFLRTSELCRSYGLRVAAFVPGSVERRGPLHLGLPTLESHRNRPAAEAANELFATGLVDSVLFGDPWATEAELRAVSEVAQEGAIRLRVRLLPGISELERQILLGGVHANRPDLSEWVIRSTASRAYAAQGAPVEPGQTLPRPRGAVTIDNQRYRRYMGELQIARQDLPRDERVNVVAQVLAEDLGLLDWIGSGTRFRFVPVE